MVKTEKTIEQIYEFVNIFDLWVTFCSVETVIQENDDDENGNKNYLQTDVKSI